MHNENAVISIEGVSKRYGKNESFILKNVSLSLGKSEFVALLGPSGSGKSTLLHIAGLLDFPTNGKIFIDNKNMQEISDNERTFVRLSKIGFVYQYHHLLQEFSAIENVMLPQLINETPKNRAKEKASALLCDLGLGNKRSFFPSELSGGQKQRVAIARALANDPILLIADEPTGNLDYETANLVFSDLICIMRKTGMSAIIATHNNGLATKMDKQFIISDGELLKK